MLFRKIVRNTLSKESRTILQNNILVKIEDVWSKKIKKYFPTVPYNW